MSDQQRETKFASECQERKKTQQKLWIHADESQLESLFLCHTVQLQSKIYQQEVWVGGGGFAFSCRGGGGGVDCQPVVQGEKRCGYCDKVQQKVTFFSILTKVLSKSKFTK